MKRLLVIAVFLSALSPGLCAGQQEAEPQNTPESAVKAETTKAKEILKQAQDALKKTKVVHYEGKYEGTGWVRQYVPNIEGTAVVGEASEYNLVRFNCQAKLTPAGSEETVELAAGCDGELYFLTDHKLKIVYADIDEAVLGSHAQDLRRLLLPEFTTDEPLKTELAAEDVQLKEPVEVDGITCHQILITFPRGRRTVWYISQQDSMPRRVDRFYPNPQQGEASTSFILTRLRAESKLTLEPFKVKVPEGYTRTDDFPPD